MLITFMTAILDQWDTLASFRQQGRNRTFDYKLLRLLELQRFELWSQTCKACALANYAIAP